MSFAYVLAKLAPLFLQAMPVFIPANVQNMSKEDVLVFLFIGLATCALLYCLYRMIVWVPEAVLKISAMFFVSLFVVGMCVTPTENRCARFSDGLIRTMNDIFGWAWDSWPKMIETIRSNFNSTTENK